MGLLIIFMQKAIGQGIGILYGALGEILTEKSGNLNLGIPGMRSSRRCSAEWAARFLLSCSARSGSSRQVTFSSNASPALNVSWTRCAGCGRATSASS